MALHLKVSNSLAELTKHLCLDLQAQNRSVFEPNLLVTQTEGMNSWLKLQLASQLGIAANYRFLKPNDLIQQVFRILGGQYQQSLSPESQCWLLYQLLGDREFIERFEKISNYYTQAGVDKELKRLALAEKVADLFDQYQMYRPSIIRNWNKGIAEGLAHEDWQMYLWIKASASSEGSLPDKTQLADYIIDALQHSENQQLLQARIPRVQLVGISVLTDFHMDLFSVIGKSIDLSFYIINPAPSEFWFDDKSEKLVSALKKKEIFKNDDDQVGNALLTSWGAVLQNTFNLLFRNDGLLNSYEEVNLVPPIENSLLHHLQADIFYNRNRQERKPLSLTDLQDRSISIHSCFTPVREVEALYNYLVHLIDEKREELSARDVVVMVSDIETYAPYIKAVFHNAPYAFPFTIADEKYTANDSMTSSLLSILSINSYNFKAEQILQLLDSSYIRKRFGVTDLSLLRKVVNQANFRFGMEGNKDDDTLFVSWKYAAQRIIYGICMSGGEEYFTEEASFFPLDSLEGNESLEVIRFCHFMDVLIASIEEREVVRSLSEWVGYIEKTIGNLVFDATENDDEEYEILMNQLLQYNGVSALVSEKITYQLFYHSVKNAVSTTVKSGTFASTGITFCSLIPMRSVPFKVVALLGINFDKFPRKENQVSFNLIENEKRKGDRNVKENDKHLFLETLLSAQKFLYISYLGQSVKDNTTIPPSALVDELLDYIQSGCEGANVSEELITRHPLHGFSAKYQTGNSKLYSYLNLQDASEIMFLGQEKEIQFDFSEVGVDSLINFLKHPIKGYFNHRLSIYYNEEDVLLSETELFDLDHLQKWSMKNTLLGIEESDAVAFRNKLLKTGGLPLKNMASIVMNTVEEDVAPARVLLQNCVGGEVERSLAIDIAFDELNVKLKGTINRVYGTKMIILSWSKNSTKYLLEAYIKFLCVRATDLEMDCYFISAAKGTLHLAHPIGAMEAKERLGELIRLYQEGHLNPLPFYADFGFEPKDIDSLTFEKYKGKVNEKMNNFKFPISDPYLIHNHKEGFFDLERTFEHHQGCASKLIIPLGEIFADYYN